MSGKKQITGVVVSEGSVRRRGKARGKERGKGEKGARSGRKVKMENCEGKGREERRNGRKRMKGK